MTSFEKKMQFGGWKKRYFKHIRRAVEQRWKKERNMEKYGHIDREFLTKMGVRVVQYQPWQFGLFYEEFEGKFVWYPGKGTLMVEYKKEDYESTKKIGEFLDTEDVYNEMMKVVRKTLE